MKKGRSFLFVFCVFISACMASKSVCVDTPKRELVQISKLQLKFDEIVSLPKLLPIRACFLGLFKGEVKTLLQKRIHLRLQKSYEKNIINIFGDTCGRLRGR